MFVGKRRNLSNGKHLVRKRKTELPWIKQLIFLKVQKHFMLYVVVWNIISMLCLRLFFIVSCPKSDCYVGSLTPPIFITWLTPDSQVSVNQEPSYWGSGKEVESNGSVKRTVWLKTRTFPFRIFVSCGEFVENSLILIVRK